MVGFKLTNNAKFKHIDIKHNRRRKQTIADGKLIMLSNNNVG